MDTPWQRAKEARGLGAEKRGAKKTGAKPQINSGRIWNSKRDLTLESIIGRILIDVKDYRQSGSFPLNLKFWEELRRDANRTPPGCLPGARIELSDDIHLIVIDEKTFDEIVNYTMSLEK